MYSKGKFAIIVTEIFLFSQDEDVAKLSESNEILKRDINEISKNIDRLENGQGKISFQVFAL